MALQPTDVWANGITPSATLDPKTAAGFACGDADPDLFNHVLQLYGAAIIELQDDYGSLTYIDAQDAALQALINANTADIATNTADIAAVLADIVQNANDIAALQGVTLPTATETVQGIVEIADATEASGSAGTQVLTVGRAQTRENRLGSIGRWFEPATGGNWETLVSGVAADNAVYNAATQQDCKGIYSVQCSTGVGGSIINFMIQIYWGQAGVNVDFVSDDNTDFVRDLQIRAIADIQNTLVQFNLLTASGAAVLPGPVIQDIRRLSMIDTVPGP